MALLHRRQQAVVYDFADSRAGEHARAFLGKWRGKLVCDDYSAYKAGFELGITEIGCAAHARRKFFELHANHKSQIAEQALKYFGALYDVERDVVELKPDQRGAVRQQRAKPIADALHAWMVGQRKLVSEGSAIARALDYSLKRWAALTRYLVDGHVPIDNNWLENQIRPWAMGRSLCTSFRILDKHWDLSFDVAATRAMFAGQRDSNRLGIQIARTDLPRGVGHNLLGGQNPILDQPADRVTGDAEQFCGFEHRQPFTILLRRPIGVDVPYAPY